MTAHYAPGPIDTGIHQCSHFHIFVSVMMLQGGFFIPQEHGTIEEHFIEKVPFKL